MPEMTGKTVAITGCTSGTGLVLAKALAQKGAKVVLLNRPSKRAEAAFEAVKPCAREAATPLNIPCDLMSFKSVREAAATLNRECAATGLDVLCNNAGIMGFPDKATEDGLDQQMQTNHTSHFLLTKLCMPLLETAAEQRGEARIVNHSSAARVLDHGGENKLDGKYMDKNGGDLGGDSTTLMSGPNFVRYQQTKLANVVFTYALEQKLRANGSSVKALVAHPGVSIDTELMAGTMDPTRGGVWAPPIPKWLIVKLLKWQSGQDATVGILRQSCDPEAKSGEFFGPLGAGGATGKHDQTEYSGPVGLLKREEVIADQAAQDLLWEVSEKAIGEKFVLYPVSYPVSAPTAAGA